MTSEYKLAPGDTIEANSGTELATKQKIFGPLFLRGGKKNVDTFQSILWSE